MGTLILHDYLHGMLITGLVSGCLTFEAGIDDHCVHFYYPKGFKKALVYGIDWPRSCPFRMLAMGSGAGHHKPLKF